MLPQTDRRTFIKQSLLTPVAAGLALSAAAQDAANKPAEAKPAPASGDAMPMGKIGKVEVSRMLLGGNLLTHFTHSRDLQYVYNLCTHYNTDEKIVETLKLAEQHGINTLSVHTVPHVLDVLRKYRIEQGGKMQWIICPTAPVEGDLSEYAQQVRELADNGTEAIYLWGVRTDQLIGEGKIELVKKAVAIAKEHNLPSGVGAHDLRCVVECEKNNVGADFYIKTFHHHNYPSAPKPDQLGDACNDVPGYWCRNPEETINVMKDVAKPWIAFKIMAAGAIPPKEAFQYVLDNGADHILVGMFDFEIAEDAAIAKTALANVKRTRPWRS